MKVMRIVFMICFLLFTASCGNSILISLQKEIDSVSKQYVEDNREGICEVKANLCPDGFIRLTGESMYCNAKKQIISLTKNYGYKIIDSIKILPDTNDIQKTMGLVSFSTINMRAKAGHSNELISQAIMGTPVKILKKSGEWILIQTPDNYLGWTNSGITPLSETEFNNWKNSDRIIFCDNYGFVYKNSDKLEPVCDLVFGSILVYHSEYKDYFKVSLPDGREGFVPKDKFIHFNQWKTSIKPEYQSLIKTAKQFSGSPYLWGGTSAKGFDCSGFVKTVYFLHGIILARDASLQYRHGVNIDIRSNFNQLQIGDLLFFGNVKTGKVNHVGMFIGNNEFIHESEMVHILSLDSTKKNFNKKQFKKLIGAKRVILSQKEKGIVHINHHSWY